MRKLSLILAVSLLMVILFVNTAFASPGKVGATCTPCHNDGRSNPAKSAVTAKTEPAKKAAPKIAAKKITKKLPAGIISKGAFAALINQAAPADASAALTWQEAAKLAVVTAGLDEEAKAMMVSHVNHALADYVDQDKITASYRPYVALAVTKGLINGAVVKGQKYFYPASMAQELYAKQIPANLAKFAKTKINWTQKIESKSYNESKMNHAFVLTGPFANGPAVTKACLKCHENAANHVLNTGHWKWEGSSTHIVGAETRTDQGKKNAINNFCIAVPSNEARCTSCHAGYGWDGKTAFDFKDKTKIDCLICHADLKATGYKKAPAGAGNPEKNVDLVKAAQSVGMPERSNCGECHYYAGGGNTKNSVKQPGLNDTLNNPTRDHDVHMGGKNMTCQACHKTENHKIAGASVNLTQRQDGMRVDCASCHNNGKPHKNDALNKHASAVACQTCHIPTFGKSKDTKMRWDWSTAGDVYREVTKTSDGNPKYDVMKGDFTWQKNVVPVYAWYNGKVNRYLLGDLNSKFTDAKGVVQIDKPAGDITEANAKIFPYKLHTGKQPSDAVYKTLLVPQLFGGYWKHYDWNKALTDGAKIAGQKYSGKYEFVESAMYMDANHEVVPAAKALKCADCHNNPNGRLDWKALGYKGDPWVFGSRK